MKNTAGNTVADVFLPERCGSPLPQRSFFVHLQSKTSMAISDFSFNTIDGHSTPLARFSGRVLLLCNTASECGFTKQYEALEKLHRRYQHEGLSVIGFPCNQFGQQEPGQATDIQQFCQIRYGVSFLLSEKIEVNGQHAHPLWQYLTEHKRGLLGSKAIKWNFTKFLIDREGKIVGRYGPLTSPQALQDRIEELLQVKTG